MQRSSETRLWPPEPLFADNSLQIHALGIHEVMPPCLVDRPHGTNDYLLMAWHGDVQLAGQSTADGTLVCWPPGAAHHYGHPTAAWDHSWLHADGPWLKNWWRRHGLPLASPMPAGERWLGLLRALAEELTGRRRPDGQIIRSYLDAWARDRALALQDHASVPNWLADLRRWLLANHHQDISIADCCQHSGLGRSRLAQLFTQYEGLSIGAWIQRARLEEAAVLLRNHNLSIHDVAVQVGYHNCSYFCKLFKNQFGSTPGQWRR